MVTNISSLVILFLPHAFARLRLVSVLEISFGQVDFLLTFLSLIV